MYNKKSDAVEVLRDLLTTYDRQHNEYRAKSGLGDHFYSIFMTARRDAWKFLNAYDDNMLENG